METQLTTRTNAANATIMERVLIVGDLAQLTPQERVNYYRSVCESVGLNPLTKPFDYISLNGKLTLYAKKDATDQLRRINDVSIGKPDIQFQDDLIIVTVEGRTPNGRTDSDIGVLRKGSMNGDVSNALMKAVTKAKRRLTLSICGLGWLDETEVETIPDAKPTTVIPETGEIVTGKGGDKQPDKTGLDAPPQKVEQPKQQMTPENFRKYIEDVAAKSPKFTIANWRDLNGKVCDMATNLGLTTEQIEAHRVPSNPNNTVTEIRAHTEALLTLCEQPETIPA